MFKKYQNIAIPADSSILYALKYMDKLGRKLLMVTENNKYSGLLSIGDIQRAIIKNSNLLRPVHEILRHDYTIARPEDSIEDVKELLLYHRAEFMPVVDENDQLIDVFFWEDFFSSEKKQEIRVKFDIPVVIMAGGFGARLKPLTNVLPKPLIPIREKTMLEEIFDNFAQYGSNRFFISLNYKADLIKYYIDNLKLDFDIQYFEEKMPSGTAGSLSLLKNKISETFFVTNCDILIEEDYSEILDFHRTNKNEITVVAALKTFPIAYGTIETEENGILTKLKEKPELTFQINTGMYILEPQLLDEIPDDELYNITDLIENLKQNNRKVGVFPVWESKWSDIGDWAEYLSVIGKSKV